MNTRSQPRTRSVFTGPRPAAPAAIDSRPAKRRARAVRIGPKPRRSDVTVPAYSSDGRKLRCYSHEAVERLLALDPCPVIAKRNRKSGQVCSLTFRPNSNSAAVEGKEPLRKTAHMGQHYCFEQALFDSGRKAWGFSRTLIPAEDKDLDDPADMERRLQLIFRAVPLSCLKELPETEQPEPPTTPANVISIRRRRGPAGCQSTEAELSPASRRAA